jgi:hypothetical protein
MKPLDVNHDRWDQGEQRENAGEKTDAEFRVEGSEVQIEEMQCNDDYEKRQDETQPPLLAIYPSRCRKVKLLIIEVHCCLPRSSSDV